MKELFLATIIGIAIGVTFQTRAAYAGSSFSESVERMAKALERIATTLEKKP